MKKNKLILLNVLWLCYELWDYLARTGGDDKGDWPGWKEVGEMALDCPCCDYVRGSNLIMNCNTCPLEAFWRKEGAPKAAPRYICEYKNRGIYVRWLNTRSEKIRMRYARRIADAALNEYMFLTVR